MATTSLTTTFFSASPDVFLTVKDNRVEPLGSIADSPAVSASRPDSSAFSISIDGRGGTFALYGSSSLTAVPVLAPIPATVELSVWTWSRVTPVSLAVHGKETPVFNSWGLLAKEAAHLTVHFLDAAS